MHGLDTGSFLVRYLSFGSLPLSTLFTRLSEPDR